MSSYVTEFFMIEKYGVSAHFQSRSFDYSNHLYNLIYGNKALCGILVYLKFSPSWNKTTRNDMRTFETDLKSLNLILYASE